MPLFFCLSFSVQCANVTDVLGMWVLSNTEFNDSFFFSKKRKNTLKHKTKRTEHQKHQVASLGANRHQRPYLNQNLHPYTDTFTDKLLLIFAKEEDNPGTLSKPCGARSSCTSCWKSEVATGEDL